MREILLYKSKRGGNSLRDDDYAFGDYAKLNEV
jgi:hypothetical protein